MIPHIFPYVYDTKLKGKVDWEFRIYFHSNLKAVLIQGVNPETSRGKQVVYGDTCRIENGIIQWIDRYHQPLHFHMYPQELREYAARLLKMKVLW
jgi:hypothetical protein